MFYERFFPPVTNRKVFGPERTPSPDALQLTNRQLFEINELDPSHDQDAKHANLAHTDPPLPCDVPESSVSSRVYTRQFGKDLLAATDTTSTFK